jgi:hypothetical protein
VLETERLDIDRDVDVILLGSTIQGHVKLYLPGTAGRPFTSAGRFFLLCFISKEAGLLILTEDEYFRRKGLTVFLHL